MGSPRCVGFATTDCQGGVAFSVMSPDLERGDGSARVFLRVSVRGVFGLGLRHNDADVHLMCLA